MGRGGVEPPTHGFSVRCSDDVTSRNDNDLRSGDPTPVSYLCQESGHTAPLGECNPPRQQAVNCSPALPNNDPELAAVVEAWDRLPEAVRARIVGLVEGATAQRATDNGISEVGG